MKININNVAYSKILVIICILCLVTKPTKAQFATPPTPTTPNNITGHPLKVHGTSTDAVYIGKGLWPDFRNTAVGTGTLENTISTFPGGYGNTAIGYNALNKVTNGSSNVGIGTSALQFSTGNNNVAIGYNALTGVLSTNSSENNIAIGSSALRINTTGNNNLSIGVNSMYNNTTGEYNLGLGSGALYGNTTGKQNCVFGVNSMYYSNSTSYNTAYGYLSLNKLTSSGNATPTDTYNSAFGYQAMANMTTGFLNAGIGHGVLTNMIVGDSNTAVGPGALSNLQYGNNNVGLGYFALVPGGNGSINSPVDNKLSIQNVIYGINMTSASAASVSIGVTGGPVGTTIAASLPVNTLAKLHVGGTLRLNTVPTGAPTGKYLFWDNAGIISEATLPSTGISSTCSTANYIPKVNSSGSPNLACSQIFDNGVSVGIAQTTGFGFTTGVATTITPNPPPTNFKLSVNGWVSGTGFTSLSDQRLKKEIKLIENPLEKIAKISGYTYFWNKDFKTERKLDDNKQAGFLAQEILKVLPEAVIKSEDGLYGLNYNAIMPLLVEGIKVQKTQIEKQEIKISDLEAKLADLTNKVNQLVPGNTLVKENLFEINPNPFTQKSVVSYTIANTTGKSMFIVFDLQGKMLKKYDVANQSGQVQINKSDLGKGMFVLSLITNGIEVQSKRFLIAE